MTKATKRMVKSSAHAGHIDDGSRSADGLRDASQIAAARGCGRRIAQNIKGAVPVYFGEQNHPAVKRDLGDVCVLGAALRARSPMPTTHAATRLPKPSAKLRAAARERSAQCGDRHQDALSQREQFVARVHLRRKSERRGDCSERQARRARGELRPARS